MNGHGGRVVLVGGTGFTGGLVARELLGRGLPFCLTGRDPAKLRRTARALETEAGGRDRRSGGQAVRGEEPKTAGRGQAPEEAGGLETAVADATEPASLTRLLSPGDVVANFAGPFTGLGHPVIGAAVESGAHYLDTAGEGPFMLEAVRRWDDRARERGVAVVNALAFEFAPGDAACALATEALGGQAVSLDVTYAFGGGPAGTSPATRASVLRVLSRRGLAYEAGEWREEPVGAHRRSVQVGSESRTALSFPAGEVVTAGQDPAVERVRGWLVAGRALAAATRLLGPVLPSAARVLRPLLEPAIRRLGPEEPTPEARKASRFVVRAEARERAGGKREVREVRGRDPYGLTARLVAEGARVLLEAGAGDGEGAPAAGVLRPSALLPPRKILDEVG